MRASQFIEQLNGLLEQYGDLEVGVLGSSEVGVLGGSELFTPEVTHSEEDWETWADRGLNVPVFIIEGSEVMELPEAWEDILDVEDEDDV